jgi:hypothetical protein
MTAPDWADTSTILLPTSTLLLSRELLVFEFGNHNVTWIMKQPLPHAAMFPLCSEIISDQSPLLSIKSLICKNHASLMSVQERKYLDTESAILTTTKPGSSFYSSLFLFAFVQASPLLERSFARVMKTRESRSPGYPFISGLHTQPIHSRSNAIDPT